VRRRAAAAIACLIGCSGPRASDSGQQAIVRVSATSGLSELEPGLEVSGTSAAVMDLVFDATGPYIESMKAEGAKVVLAVPATSRRSAPQLAAALRCKEMVSARAVGERRIEAQFPDDKTAALAVQYDAFGFDLGPFEVDSQDSKQIRLVRRGEGAIDVIEAQASTRSDEWRKLLAHELDVVPLAASLYRAEFAGIASIRVLDIPPRDSAALFFNVRSTLLADARTRRRIASAIHREAIARLACGVASCASPAVESLDAAVAAPQRLSLMVPEHDTPLLLAAKIIRHQLFSIGTDLEIQPVSIATYTDRQTRGDYTLALGPLSDGARNYGFFLSPGHPKGLWLTGFASPEYDAAVDRGDLATAQAILDRELPVTRLFELRSFAAVDSAFCGKVTPSGSSWRWLAELYPCEEGAPP